MLLSFAILGERFSGRFFIALAVMIAGAVLVVIDTLIKRHEHPHQHVFSHCHGGAIHEHTVEHRHAHDHCPGPEKHTHRHPLAQLEAIADGGTKNP